MNILLNQMELDALSELPHIVRCLYVFAIRPRMDLATSMVGIKPKISWQALGEWLYVAPHPGIKSGSPSKGQLRRAANQLEKVGLIKTLSKDKQLIFKCLLVNQGKFTQNKADTKPAEQTDTKPAGRNGINSDACVNELSKNEQQKNVKADTHHSNNLTDLNFTSSNSLSCQVLEAVPQKPEEWLGYFVDTLKFPVQKTHTAKNVVMFERWCSLGLSINTIRQAIAIAETKLGHKPETPSYYRNFVNALLQEEQNSQLIHEKNNTNFKFKQEVSYVNTKRPKSAAARMWEFCESGLEGSDLDPNNRTRH